MKTCLRLLLLPFLVAALSGCGLPTVTYLYPPQNFFFSGSATISVQNDSRNHEASEGTSQTFKGIEIFYRIYQDSAAASSMLSILGNLSQSYDGNPDRFMAAATGNTYKFVRLRNLNDQIQPLIPINDATDESIYSIDLNGTSDWVLTNTSAKIIRTISTVSNKSFFSRDFRTDDDDYSGTTASAGSTYYVVFFAVSYGQDQVTVGQNVYSMPAIPGSIATYYP